jgi:hypothetical protein
MAPSTTEDSPSPFLNGIRGHLGHSMPQVEDDTLATDLRKEMEEEEEKNRSK